MTDIGIEAIRIDCKAPPPIDPHEHHAAMYALGLLEPLGMATPPDLQPTPGLLSYLHDPERRRWRRNRQIEFGWNKHDEHDEIQSHGQSADSHDAND